MSAPENSTNRAASVDSSKRREPRGPVCESSDARNWVDDHGDVLFRYAVSRVRNRDTAEDLVQETLVAGLRARASFSRRANVQTWLIGILRRKIVDYFRASRREYALREDLDQSATHQLYFNEKRQWKETLGKWPNDPRAILENKEFWKVFRECLSRLPVPLADAFLSREQEQLPTKEICNQLGISATNLAVRLHRARLQMRHCLEKNWFHK